MKLIKIICIMTILLFWIVPCDAEEANHQTLRQKARQAYSDGNWKDAYDLYRKLGLEVENDPRSVGADLIQAWQCLQQLNRLSELDAFREQVIGRHRNNWRLLQAAAQSYIQNPHWGHMIAGEFERGEHRGGGKYVNAIQRDRVRALQLMNEALKLTARESAKSEVAYFYLEFARFFMQYRGYHQAWRLQYLTDLSRLPDYEPGYGYEYGQRQMGAPADTLNRPILHHIPESFEAAETDGERWRYLQTAAVQLDHRLESRVIYEFASFLHQQFGVQTLREYGNFFFGRRARSEEDIQKDSSGPYEIHTLGDDETIAKLAVGVRRFSLPPGFNYIKLLDGVVQKPDGGYAHYATRLLAQIYENRRQYDRAAEYWH
ncbi:MAG: alpha-2-macroglobulin, partial [Deltaproteobacteria bacterium]|nr:alpha-2-macroglobulin [Deltaproteobacteria bacterium]